MNAKERWVLRALLPLALLACGDDGLRLPTDPDPTPPEDEMPPPPPILGDTVIAFDLDNRLIVFGTESSGSISRAYRIRGLPILNRIIGIAHRPSTGELYGVGDDSRVYLLDPWSGEATAVNQERFTPVISNFFDIHFGMTFDPVTEKIRLVAAESQSNWIIDPDDGTAVAGSPLRYVEGDPNEGRTPSISGLTYMSVPPGDPTLAILADFASDCEKLLYAIDPDLAWIVGSCDPDKGDYISLVDIERPFARCTSIAEGPDGMWGLLKELNDEVNSWGRVDPETGLIEWADPVPDPSPIQGFHFPRGRGVSGADPAFARSVTRRRPSGLPVGVDGRGLMSLPTNASMTGSGSRCPAGPGVVE